MSAPAPPAAAPAARGARAALAVRILLWCALAVVLLGGVAWIVAGQARGPGWAWWALVVALALLVAAQFTHTLSAPAPRRAWTVLLCVLSLAAAPLVALVGYAAAETLAYVGRMEETRRFDASEEGQRRAQQRLERQRLLGDTYVLGENSRPEMLRPAGDADSIVVLGSDRPLLRDGLRLRFLGFDVAPLSAQAAGDAVEDPGRYAAVTVRVAYEPAEGAAEGADPTSGIPPGDRLAEARTRLVLADGEVRWGTGCSVQPLAPRALDPNRGEFTACVVVPKEKTAGLSLSLSLPRPVPGAAPGFTVIWSEDPAGIEKLLGR